MIASAMRYAGPNAAVRTLLGDLLRQSDYKLLLNAADSSELLTALGTTRYAPALHTQGRSFAYVLRLDWISRTEKVANLQPANGRELCNAYLAKIEVEALKTLLRGVFRGVERRGLLSMLPPLPASSSLPLTGLIAINNLEQAVRVLTHSAYANAVNQGIKEGTAGGDALWSIEAALDRGYFVRLEAACRDFYGYEGAIITRLFGAIADTFNVLTAERLRKTFRLTPEAVRRQLLPVGLRLRADQRRALCEWSGEGLPPASFDRIIAGRKLTIPLMRALCSEAMKPLFTVPFHAGLAISYVLLSEFETADLLTIYEGKHWGIERAEIADGLIRFYGPALTGGSDV
jgi:vacuolar-type H+-ATPase subunit C/Vma6